MSAGAPDTLTLASGNLSATIVPALGAGLADFSIKGPTGYFYPIMRRAVPGERNASMLGSFFMAPWANRVGGARFEFGGRARTLRPTSPPGTPAEQVVAQHGDVRKRPWTVQASSPTSVELAYDSRDFADSNWPWSYRCRARYELLPQALTIELSVTNTDHEPFPAGCGHHPYFARRLWDDRDELHIRVPVAGRYPLVHACATGPASPDDLSRRLLQLAPVPAEPIDAVFAAHEVGERENTAELRWPCSGVTLRIEADEHLRHWVVFSPHASASAVSPLSVVAIEPQSQVNDAFNLDARGVKGTGSRVLEPEETLSTRCRFVVV